MNSEDNKAGRSAATKVGGMRVPAHDHCVPVVRKEHDAKKTQNETEAEDEDERNLERLERFEYEKQTRLAAGERLSKWQENHPKNETINNFRQKENIHVNQPILHTHNKSGSAAQQN
ncbi:hypothetical protein BGZ74_001235 [Mortierella antarctica]|nr:hypothetical protein BGZ74_001235 [Mortierella antarctica]KAG0357411.1 hypothetical protein BG005_003567 [Podila minutissima]